MRILTQLFGSPVPQLEPEQVQAQLAHKPGPLLLDVRQPEEYQAGHIPGARLIPLGELPQRISELPRGQEIICVCRSGNRSSTATRQLRSANFNAANLKGGMIAWSRAGLPVRRGLPKREERRSVS